MVPDVEAEDGIIEVPVGLIDGELDLSVDRHIFVEHRPSWDHDLDDLPEFTAPELRELRTRNRVSD